MEIKPGAERENGRTGRERSISDLCQTDDRNVGWVAVDDSTGTIFSVDVEDLQSEFHRAESSLAVKVPTRIRERIAVAQSLATYGWFCYEFFTVSAFWSLSCLEMALRARFGETHPGPLQLRRKRKTETVPNFRVDEMLRQHWRIVGLEDFDFSFRSLLKWAEDSSFLPVGVTPQYFVELRNSMAHPDSFNWVLLPGDALTVFRLLIQIVVALWPLEGDESSAS